MKRDAEINREREMLGGTEKGREGERDREEWYRNKEGRRQRHSGFISF